MLMTRKVVSEVMWWGIEVGRRWEADGIGATSRRGPRGTCTASRRNDRTALSVRNARGGSGITTSVIPSASRLRLQEGGWGTGHP